MDHHHLQDSGDTAWPEGPSLYSSLSPADAPLIAETSDHQSTSSRLHLEHRLRAQLGQACKFAKRLDQKLLCTPIGHLVEPHNLHLRISFAMDTLDLVSAFNEAAKLFIANSSVLPPSSSSLPPFSIISTLHLQNNPPTITLGEPVQDGLHSPMSEMSDGSPNQKSLCDSALLMTMTTTAAAAATTALPSSTAAPTSTTKDVNFKKRKQEPKLTLRLPQNYFEQTADTPPVDGHTWRKYGQKGILGAEHPRNYYRCTHRNDLGCPAIKQVQRCDDNRAVFVVTYRGHHTCRSNDNWPFAFAHHLSQFVNNLLQFSICPLFDAAHQAFLPHDRLPSTATGSIADVELASTFGRLLNQERQCNQGIGCGSSDSIVGATTKSPNPPDHTTSEGGGQPSFKLPDIFPTYLHESWALASGTMQPTTPCLSTLSETIPVFTSSDALQSSKTMVTQGTASNETAPSPNFAEHTELMGFYGMDHH